MKRFRSKLEPVQTVRAHHQHTAALELARAIQAVRVTTTQIGALHEERDKSYAYSDWDQFNAVYWAHQYRKRLYIRLSELQKRLHNERQRLHACQQNYRQAHIRHHTLEMLIHNQKAAYLKKQHSIAEDHADDISRYLLSKQ